MILFGGSGSGSGSGSEKPYDPATDVPDLTGKVMIVTGGIYKDIHTYST